MQLYIYRCANFCHLSDQMQQQFLFFLKKEYPPNTDRVFHFSHPLIDKSRSFCGKIPNIDFGFLLVNPKSSAI
jgi:hypothetical protein